MARLQQETEQRERVETIRQETSEAATITTTEKKKEKPEETLVAEGRPAQEITREQKAAERQKASPAPQRTSELMSRLKGERAATKEEIAAEEELMEEITGLIIEQTMTRIGYDFYEYFFLLWEAPREVGVKDYNIFIDERASPMWGSWVSVGVNGATVWNKVLRPRSAEVEDAAKEAIVATQQYLINYEQYQFQSEDMVGSGI